MHAGSIGADESGGGANERRPVRFEDVVQVVVARLDRLNLVQRVHVEELSGTEAVVAMAGKQPGTAGADATLPGEPRGIAEGVRMTNRTPPLLVNNLKCIELSDLDADLPLDVAQSTALAIN